MDILDKLNPLSRADHPVRYYYVDFGLSEQFSPGAPGLVVGDVGRDDEVPELSSTIPYDGYKADVYALGNLFFKEIVQVRSSQLLIGRIRFPSASHCCRNITMSTSSWSSSNQ